MGNLLSQLAIAALAGRNGASPGVLQRLALSLAGLVAVFVMLLIAGLCAIAGALLLWAPPLEMPQLLFLFTALLAFVALLTWLTLCKGQTPGEMIADAFDAEPGPLEVVNRAFDRVSDAFSRGWYSR